MWKKRRVVKTGIPTQRSSPLLFAIISDDIDISDTSNSAKWSWRQNISEGWSVVTHEIDRVGRDPPVEWMGQVRGLRARGDD